MRKIDYKFVLLFFILCSGITIADDIRFGSNHEDPGRWVELHQLNGIETAIAVFKDVNGRLPTTWDEIGTIFDFANEDRVMLRAFGYRFRDRYKFVTEALPMYGNFGHASDIEDGTRVILVRITPYGSHDIKSAARSFIYENKKGEIINVVIREDRAQILFHDFGFTIQLPFGIPPVDLNSAAARQSFASTILKRGVEVWPPVTNSMIPEHPKKLESASGVVPMGESVRIPIVAFLWTAVGLLLLIAIVGLFFLRRKRSKLPSGPQ